MKRTTLWALVAVGLMGGGCGSDEAEGCAASEQGSLSVTIYGENFIEERIPSSEVSDGWELRFDKFLLSLRQVAATRAGCAAPGVDSDQGWLFDLSEATQGQGRVVLEAQADVGTYPHVDYEVGPPVGQLSAGNASLQDVTLVTDGGYSVYVEGEATHATKGTKRFAWGFGTTTRYTACESSAEVATGGGGKAELTIHGDHLLYDDLVSPEPNLAFDLIAEADGDADGEITMTELEAKSIIGQARYGVGNYTEVENLAQFLSHLVGTVGHIDGEGHCHTEG